MSSIYMMGDYHLNEGSFNLNYHHEIDYGLDFYASQTRVDSKGRCIMVAWMKG